MPFECKKYHGKCGARCCGVVPIAKSLWNKKKTLIQRQPIEIIEGKSREGKIVLPVTEDMLCPFLKDDLSCAIYDERPQVCRKFGDETHEMLCCPMQDKCGNPRDEVRS